MGEWSQNRAAATWKNLADAYGPRFLRDFGDQPPAIWVSAIQNLKDHEIARGFRRLSLHGSASPPTLPQFVKACRMVGEEDGPSAPTNQPQLPAPEIDDFALWANQEMLKFLLRQRGAKLSCVPAMVAAKNKLVQQYRSIHADDPVSEKEFREAIPKALLKVWVSDEPQQELKRA